MNNTTAVGLCLSRQAGTSSNLVAASERLTLPLSLLGIIGNALSLLGLTDPAMRNSLGSRSAKLGLVALAVSDLLFSLCVLPTGLVGRLSASRGFGYYYHLAAPAVISTFIMSSTLLTVALAVQRCLAVCQPLQARSGRGPVDGRRGRMAITGAFVFAAVFNLPMLRASHSRRCLARLGDSGTEWQLLYATEAVAIVSPKVDTAYRVMWALAGNVLPLIVLVYCNARLLLSVRRAIANRRRLTNNRGGGGGSNRFRGSSSTSPAADSHPGVTITITLVCIVVTFLVLVAPSETLKLYSLLRAGQSGEQAESLESNADYKSVEAVTNCMQCLGFSLNFVLYCFALRSFRQTVCRRLLRLRLRRRSQLPLRLRATGGGTRSGQSRQKPVAEVPPVL